MADSWERQQGESQPAYDAFCIFRDLPHGQEPEKRSCSRVAKRIGKSVSLIERWSQHHDWQERARAYDNELQQEAMEARKGAIRQMQEKHIAISQKVAELARKGLDALNVEDLRPRNVIDLLKISTELERRARFELLAESEVQAEYEPDNITYNPMLQLVKSLEDARKEKRAKGLDEAEQVIRVNFVDEDMSRLTPEEQKEYERLREKAEVLKDSP